jgi:D-hexose-6-phosphate mutarotase
MEKKMERVEKLNREFGIDGVLSFIKQGELIILEGKNKFANFALSLHGAHVTSYQPTGSRENILWLSKESNFKKDKPIRGGIPICWPWFGPHPEDSTKPSHGFARLADWTLTETALLENGTVTVTLELTSDCETRKLWPYEFKLQNKITIGDTLKLELITKNRDSKPFTITSALHSYFNICDIRNISIHGLDNTQYIDSMDNDKIKTQEGAVTFNSEVDRVYIDTTERSIISDQGYSREISIAKQGSRSTVVWNPWIEKSRRMSDFGNDEYQTMVCVETTNALSDNITINPDKEHSLICEIYI